MKSDDLEKRLQSNLSDINGSISEIKDLSVEVAKVHYVLHNTQEILNDLDEQFCRATGLTAVDSAFLFLATGLQIARQYLLTEFPKRLSDKEAAEKTPGHHEEHSSRSHRYYNPSLEEIITNPVPFDALIGSNGALTGGGKLGHRVTAIGHDPLLGLIFGTANIATSTLTTSNFESFHICTSNKKDYFKNRASTALVLEKTGEKLISQGIDGKMIVAASLCKEIVHLNSDISTKHSLPIPIVSTIDPKLASELANYGLDMANVVAVGKQATVSILINTIISMLHRLFYESNKPCDEALYEVRTRKILSYSNLIASSSNIAVVGVTKDFNKLDLGGLAVTIARLMSDYSFIKSIKEEFIFGQYKAMLEGED